MNKERLTPPASQGLRYGRSAVMCTTISLLFH